MAVHNIDSYFKTKAMEFHQNIYDRISDWNEYDFRNFKCLRKYISIVFSLENFDERTCKILDSFETTLDQKSNHIIDQIYNTIVTPNVPLIQCCGLHIFTYNHNAAEACKDNKLCDLIETHAVIKVKRGYNSSLSDIIYIDEYARIYKSWDDFIKNNKLSECTMYVPKNGIYQANLRETWSEDFCPVWIEKFINNNVCNNIDTVCNVINISLTGVAIASLFNPIGATIQSSVLVGKCIAGIWTSSRAVHKLHDRKKHCQSIMPTDTETISSYLGILDNVCIGTHTATSTIISKAVNTGSTVGKSIKFIHNSAIIGNTVLSTSELVTNSVTFFSKVNKSDEVAFKDVLALGINFLLFYNSIVSVKFASELIELKQDNIINEYQKSLCNKKRRNQFNRLVRKVKCNTNNTIQQNEQIIRSVKKVNNQESFFKLLMENDFTSLNALSRKNFNCQKILDFTQMLIDNTLLNDDLSRENNSNKKKPSSINSLNINIELQCFSNLKKILASIENFNCTEMISNFLMNGAIKFTENKSKNIDMAIGFIWKYLKYRLNKWNVTTISIEYESIIKNVLAHIYQYIISTTKEWILAFKQYLENNLNIPLTKSTTDLNAINSTTSRLLTANPDTNLVTITDKLYDSIGQCYNSIMNALIVFQSQVLNRNSIINDCMKIMYENETHEYFLAYPEKYHINMKNIELLSGLLNDIKDYKENNIILYKLICIAMAVWDDIIYLNFEDILNFVWISVIMQFVQLNSQSKIEENMIEIEIMKIIIAIYHDRREKPSKWINSCNVYYEFKILYFDNRLKIPIE